MYDGNCNLTTNGLLFSGWSSRWSLCCGAGRYAGEAGHHKHKLLVPCDTWCCLCCSTTIPVSGFHVIYSRISNSKSCLNLVYSKRTWMVLSQSRISSAHADVARPSVSGFPGKMPSAGNLDGMQDSFSSFLSHLLARCCLP